MIARAGSGWQYALADLSLILFLVMASALGEADAVPAAVPGVLPAMAEPVAVWRAGGGAPSLGQWLGAQPQDPRLRLTVIAQYTAGHEAAAFASAKALLSDGGARPVRVVLELAPVDEIAAALTWDLAPPVKPDLSVNQKVAP